MGDFREIIEILVKDTCVVFDRTPTMHMPRPVGITLVGCAARRDEVLTAFRRCPYFVANDVPIVCIDSVSTQDEGFYRIDLDYFFRYG